MFGLDDVVSGVTNFVGDTFGKAQDFLWGQAQQRQDWKYAKKSSDYQLANQIALIDYQNEYNTPANQMARYKAAGLNPNLIYGQSNLSAGGSASGVSAPRQNKLLSQASYANLRVQNENLQIQNQLLHAQADKATADASREKIRLAYEEEVYNKWVTSGKHGLPNEIYPQSIQGIIGEGLNTASEAVGSAVDWVAEHNPISWVMDKFSQDEPSTDAREQELMDLALEPIDDAIDKHPEILKGNLGSFYGDVSNIIEKVAHGHPEVYRKLWNYVKAITASAKTPARWYDKIYNFFR